MNDARVHDNWIFDNWRDGAMLFAVPDALTNGGGAEGDIFPGVSCPGAPANGLSTSCGNRFFDNQMGQAPHGFKFPKAVDQFGNAHSARRRAAEDAQRQRLLVGRVLRRTPATAGSATRAPTARPAASPAPARRAASPATRRRSCPRTAPRASATRPRQARVPDRLRERPRRGHRADRLRLVDGPAPPGSKSAARERKRKAAAARKLRRSPEARELKRRVAALTD